MKQLPLYKRLHWPVTLFLIGTPIIALTFTPIHIYMNGIEWPVFAAFLVYSVMTTMCITGGYHRLFSHLSYEAKPWVKFLYLVLGSASWQASALKWCSDHRRHHRFVDTNVDPYNINRGFFFAHFGWLLLKDDPKYDGVFEADLLNDPLIVWQHKYYIPLAILMGFGVPMGIGWMMGSPWGGLIIIGFLRIVISQHFTFFINSLCHMIGSRPYSDKVTARDNLVLAIFTYGEGYHNFHHRFATDYRNGIRWYQWDPTKWTIRLMSFFGWTWSLKTVPNTEILRARMAQDVKLLLASGAPKDRLSAMSAKVVEAQKQFRLLRVEYKKLKRSVSEGSRRHLAQLKAETKIAKLEFKMAFAQWTTFRRAWPSYI